MVENQNPGKKPSLQVPLGIALAYGGLLMLMVFVGQHLFFRWHQAPSDVSPARHVYASGELVMATLLVVVTIAITMAFRQLLPSGIWHAVTEYSKHQSPKRRFVVAMWMGIYVILLVLFAAVFLARAAPGLSWWFTVAIGVALVAMWSIQVRQTYKAWKESAGDPRQSQQ